MARWFFPNPGFELGDRDWSGVDFAIINDAVNARSGAWVGQFTGAGSNILSVRAFSVRPGAVIDAGIWIKGGTGGTAKVRAQWLDVDGVNIAFASGSVVAAGSPYTQSTAVFTAPDRTKTVKLGAVVEGSASGTWFIDDMLASGDIIEEIPASAKIASHRFIESRTIASFSPLIGPQKFSDFNAGMSDGWAGRYTFIPLHPNGDLGELLAFLTRLGKQERFFAFDPDRLVPKNGVVNGIVVDGGANGGNTRIPVRNGPINTTALVAGDYAEVRAQYFELQRDLEIGPEGTGEMIVWPSVRTSIDDGEDVITDHPKMVARITSDIPRLSDHTKWTEITASWEEVV